MPRARFLIIAAALVAATLGLYATRLSYAPIYLVHDEANFSIQAASVARTGRDLNGRLLPVYFSEPEFPAGRDPLMVYATALVLQFMPLSETSVRLSTAIVGTLDVLLIIWLARELSGNAYFALCAGALLALSPGHFMSSRMALSVLFPVPFVLAWLICLRRYEQHHDVRALRVAGAALGLCIYAYLAAVVLVPLYVALTLFLLYQRREYAAAGNFLAAFAVLLIPLVGWQIAHPERFGNLVGAYQAGGATAGSFARDIPALVSLEGVRFRLGQWWSYFDPTYLFISGDTSINNSTREAGIFPLACALLFPAGLVRLWRGTNVERLILIGFFTAPIAIVLTGTLNLHRYRGLVIFPFGALLATYGVAWLWERRNNFGKAIAIVLVATIPLQFWSFYQIYMGPYRNASSIWFGRDLRSALVDVLQRRSPSDAVYLSDHIPYNGTYWRFYSMVAGDKAADEARKPAGDDFDPAAAARGSWLVVAADEARLPAIEQGGWIRQETIAEPSGEKSFVVYRKIN